MSKKTAISQLIEKWESEMGSYIPNGPIFKAFIKDAKMYLEKEKQQIKSAFELGMIKASSSSRYISDIEAENYYSQTYQNETE